MKICPGCQTEIASEVMACEACGMRFDQNELTIDWAAIEYARARQQRSLASKIVPMMLWAASVGMLLWLASPYLAITQYISEQGQPVDLRGHLDQHHNFPEPGTYVQGKELTLGYKGAEWRRIRRFAITRDDMVYIQVIGAVCPYEMPRERCRKVLVELPKSNTDFERYRPASVITVDGRLHRVTKTSEFAPLIPFLAREMHMDADGAYVLAHGVRPRLGRDGMIFWSTVLLILLLLSAFLYRLLRS